MHLTPFRQVGETPGVALNQAAVLSCIGVDFFTALDVFCTSMIVPQITDVVNNGDFRRF